MNSQLSALVGLTAAWLVISIASVVAFDPTTGFSPITLAFLLIFGAFTVFQAMRYSRALKKEKAKTDARRDRGF